MEIGGVASVVAAADGFKGKTDAHKSEQDIR
jgi:hypothetical protein